MNRLSDGLAALRDLLEAFKPGTVRHWADGDYVKQPDGTWLPVAKQPKTISAKYASVCPDCKKPINQGDKLAKSNNDNRWKCPDCWKADAVKNAPPPPAETEEPAAAEAPAPKKVKIKKPKMPVYNPPAPEDKIETATCGRCLGSGKFSYNQIDGDRCYGCGGSGIALTKRGKVANDYLLKLRETPVSQLKVGDLIKHDATMFSAAHFGKVTKIEPYVQKGETMKNGVMVPYETTYLGIESEHPKYGKHHTSVKPDGMVRKGLSKEEKIAQNKKAYEFQKMLNYNGTPKPGAVIPPEMANYPFKKKKGE